MATYQELLQKDPNAAFKQGASLSGSALNSYVSPTGSISNPPSTTPTLSQPTTQTSPFALSQVMDTLKSKVQSNNALMSQRNLLLKHLYNQPLTEPEKLQLDPTMLQAINAGDRNQIDMKLRLISDEISGRTSGLDKNIQYLTTAYNDTIKQAEAQRQDAIKNVLDFAQVYGSNAKSALTSLYGKDYVDQLKNQGIDLDKFSSLATLDQMKEGGLGGGGIIPQGIIDFDDPTVVSKLPVSTLAKAVISGTGSLKDMTPTDKSKVISELYTVGFNPHDVVIRKLNGLADSWENIPQGYKGLVQVRTTPWATSADVQSAEFESAKEVLTRIVARLNDVGMLSDQDVASYKKAMPSRGDRNIEVVKSKIEGLKTALGGSKKQTTSGKETVLMVGSDGSKWNVPKDKIEVFKQNGYKEI